MNAKLKTLSRIFAVILSAIIMISVVACAEESANNDTPASAGQSQPSASVSVSENNGNNNSASGGQSASGDQSASGGQSGTASNYEVAFDSMGGNSVDTQTVENGQFATKPADPARDGFDFAGWAKDKNGSELFDFAKESVTANITLFAVWAEQTATGDACKARFFTNDGTYAVYATVDFNKGDRIKAPTTDPTNGTSKFQGWFQKDGTAYAKATRYEDNVYFYAKWLIEYKLEAEDTQLIDLDPDEDETATMDGLKTGYGRSGNMAGAKMISEDVAASGGKFVRGLYYTDAFLEFKFTAEKDCTAQLYASFACEFKDYDLTQDDIGFEVNGTFVSFTQTISLKAYDLNGGVISFTEFYIADVDLQKGENVIKLVMVNKNKIRPFPDGTVKAPAPIVDCLTVYAETEIEVSKYNNFPNA